jgi:hypothetical protein
MAADYLQDQMAAIVAQAMVWSDRIYWNGYGPLAEAAIVVATVAAAGLCTLAWADEKDTRIWSCLTVAGRWMGAIAVVVVSLAMGLGGHGAV